MSTNDDYNKFLYTFTKNVLNSDKSIRWVGIIDRNGIIINEHYREGLKPLLTKEENQESAINTIAVKEKKKQYGNRRNKSICFRDVILCCSPDGNRWRLFGLVVDTREEDNCIGITWWHYSFCIWHNSYSFNQPILEESMLHMAESLFYHL